MASAPAGQRRGADGGGGRPRQDRRRGGARRPGLATVVAAVLAVVVVASGLATAAPSPVAAAEAVFKEDRWVYGPNVEQEVGDQVVYGGQLPFGGPGPLNGSYVTNDDWSIDMDAPFSSPYTRPLGDEPYYYNNRATLEVTISGANGMTGREGPFSGGDIRVFCESPDVQYGEGPAALRYCSIPSGTYSIQVQWNFTVRDGPCVRAYILSHPTDPNSFTDACPLTTVTGQNTRTVLPGYPENQPPTAAFEANPSPTDPLEVAFESRSTDPETSPTGLGHRWDFGDGSTSTERNPTHVFARPGSYVVTLLVIDSGGRTATTSSTLSLDSDLVVNSTGDDPAEDPGRGCDTGGEVGDPAVRECTLRAAIEAANADGGGEVSFAIDGGGTPSIALGSALPAITTDTVVDGTSQEGGFVGLTGGGENQMVLAGGTAEVRGLVFDEGGVGLSVTGGSDHVIEGNRFGTDATGTTLGDLSQGVAAVGGSGGTVRGNVFGVNAVAVDVAAEASGWTVADNAIGVDADRTAALGEVRGGVLAAGPDVTVSGNTVRGQIVGIELLGASASGATIEGNQVGVDLTGASALGGVGYGIRVDGAPGAEIRGNRVVADEFVGILVLGSDQATDDDGLELTEPLNVDEGLPVTGGSATVADNIVGVLAGGGSGGGEATEGIWLLAGTAGTVVEGNTVAGMTGAGVDVTGGSGNRISGNEVGTLDGAAVDPVPLAGVAIFSSAGAVVGGGSGQGNTILSQNQGVQIEGEGASGASVLGNDITADGDEQEAVLISSSAERVTVQGNTIVGARFGVKTLAGETQILGNTIAGSTDAGIDAASSDIAIWDNVVVGGADGIRSFGGGATIRRNRVGQRVEGGATIGNTGTGIDASGGPVEVTGNVVAGSGGNGIDVTRSGMARALARLSANRVFSTTGEPIVAPDGPTPPTLAAAVRTTTFGSTRTTLVLTGLPEGDAGTIEVFANSSCADPEAEYVLGLTRVKEPDEQTRILHLPASTTRDSFTVTYTDASGNTSALSGCQASQTYADGDGDGSLDPFDGVLDADSDASTAVVATEAEELLVLRSGSGTLSGAGPADDPAPGAHPAGWSLPHGAISFRVTGLEPGASSDVLLSTVAGSVPIEGNSYWKYGPPEPGAAARWYLFDQDAATGTGAEITTTSVAGEPTRAFLLHLTDGARGDSDGGADGTITDPGGPVIGGDTDPTDPTDPVDPVDPTDPTAPVDPTDPTTPVDPTDPIDPTDPTTPVDPTGPSGPNGPSVDPTGVDPAGQSPGATSGNGDQQATQLNAPGPGAGNGGIGALPRTGTDLTGLLQTAVLLCAGGAALLVGRRRLRPERSS